MMRVTAPVVVEAVGETVDAGEATGSAGVCADNASALVAADGGDDVGEAVEGGDHVGEAADGWDEALSGPGPSGGDASMDDFLPRPRPWFFSFLTSSDAAGDEVIFSIFFLIGGAFCY
jgi:hypothetical protein